MALPSSNVVPLRPGAPAQSYGTPGGAGGGAEQGNALGSPFGAAYVGDAPDIAGEDIDPPNVSDLRKQFTDYVTIKQNEIEEARLAIQYYHGKQFTVDQLKRLKDRGQAPVIFNRVVRKVNGLVGALKKLRGDPKAFGRNAPDEAGAELATQCVRYALDASDWGTQESEALTMGACTGIVVAELALPMGDQQDPDVDVTAADPRSFFYDARSLKLDFSDARFMGVSKFMTQDEFEEMFPGEPDPENGEYGKGRWEECFGSSDEGQTQFDSDLAYLWSQGRSKLRVIEHWYRVKREWRYCFYAGSVILAYGRSPFYDEKGQTICRFIAFAVSIDEDGDHYGFVRHFKGPQDAMNSHRTKAVWIAHARQLKVSRRSMGGDGQDIETKRREASRADGVLIFENDPNEVEVLTQDAEFLKHMEFYADAKQEIDTFGPNPALAGGGGGPADVSGRSLAMQQQASVAELGPFLSQWNGWRKRIYRGIWVQQQRNWQAQRVLRVTKNEQVAQYVAINQPTGGVDQFGRPILANAIGNIDVEIIMDEGPSEVNIMADSFDTLSALATKGLLQGPLAQAIVELSPLSRSTKDKVMPMLAPPPPSPQQQQAAQAEIENKQADTAKKGAEAQEAGATAVHKLALAHHETHRAQATSTGAAIDALGAMQPAQSAAPPPQQFPQQ
jgi:hypothetical protein